VFLTCILIFFLNINEFNETDEKNFTSERLHFEKSIQIILQAKFMKQIIPPVDIQKIEEELTNDKFVRKTNFSDNEIYILTAQNSPNTMLEIGRLREEAFRLAGGGTGKEVDIDKYDTAEYPYKQMIVWNPREKEIIGGYRYYNANEHFPITDENGDLNLATARLLSFSETFKKEFLPETIELGRSFVRASYQSKNAGRKGIFALDNLWDGLGAIIQGVPGVKYFFGKVTMYTTYNQKARDLILYFMSKQFPDKLNLIKPKKALKLYTKIEDLKHFFNHLDYKENHKELSKEVRTLGETIPPLINTYMNISDTMMSFGTSLNEHFGGVEETGILITINDIHLAKKERHIESFKTQGNLNFKAY